MSDFNFSNLYPERLLDALESVHLYADSGLLALNSYENRVYQFHADDGNRYVVKFYRPQRWSDAQILEEHQFCFELIEAELPVVAPLKFEGESLLAFDDLRFAVFPSAGGRNFEVDNLDQLAQLGQYMGRIHQLAAGKKFQYRPEITLHDYVDLPLTELQQWLPESLQTPFFTIAQQVAEQVRQQYRPQQSIRLHGDCHPGNILWRDGPILVDLDDARSGPVVQDLWMLLNGDQNEQRLQLETLLEGYEDFCHFPTEQLRLIEPLRAMRMIHYMGWLAKRWEDSAFQRAFPWFNSQQYWENQILSLKEQLAALQEPPLSLIPY
ncbi:serine/threonine protein kinase [Celerinatantimonas sp. YJH-8]|uniref:serine/threonine protein kinase n=1 Tax=Celerinatantimonas sp. YJH-8 TaxID=3228714 RepID=UPI0038C2E526